MNKLYVGLDTLDVLEQLEDKEFDLIYLDVPYGTGDNFAYNFSDVSIRHQIAKEKGLHLKISPRMR